MFSTSEEEFTQNKLYSSLVKKFPSFRKIIFKGAAVETVEISLRLQECLYCIPNSTVSKT